MAFRLGSADDGELPVNHEINVTPFIDVMLVLLIIFMVAAPLATVDIKVDLPVAEAAPSQRSEEPVFITLESSGRLTVNDREVPFAGLGSEVERLTGQDREQRIFLRADRTVPYDNLMQAMNSLRRSGYVRVALVAAESGHAG